MKKCVTAGERADIIPERAVYRLVRSGTVNLTGSSYWMSEVEIKGQCIVVQPRSVIEVVK
jgi:hypothetical protein